MSKPSGQATLYCKWCGSNEHVAGVDCPRMKSKWGSKDDPNKPGEWRWFFPPEYSTWHSTEVARKADAEMLGLDGER